MEDDQKPLRLLSFDGGGIRGLSSLYILKSIMNSLGTKVGQPLNQPLCPCDYFDLIAGTSTGGLIAVMLGILRMDIDTCINEYLDIAPKIFPVEDTFSGSAVGKFLTVARGQQRFDPRPLESAIKRLVMEHLGDQATAGEDTLFRFRTSKTSESHKCNVFVCVTSEKLGKPFRFRSYESPWDVVDDCPIWQACRATSAAPTFFPPIEIGRPPTAYVDGGLGYNNPIRGLMEESSHIWPLGREVGCVVSIGTGVLMSRDIGRTIKPLFECLKDMATDTEKVGREFEEEMKYKYGSEQQVYFRFNVQHGLEYVGLEEWKEMDRTKVATLDYLRTQWSQVERCASQLFQPRSPILLGAVNVPDTYFFNITMRQVRTFVARSALYNALKMGFNGDLRQTHQIQHIAVVYGLGGAGKSQLVLDYVQTVRTRYSGVFWIDARDKDSVERDFGQLYRLLFRTQTVNNQDLPKSEEIILLVRDWFVRQAGRFLLVFDGADNIDNAGEPSYVNLNKFIPQCTSVNVIVTTRLFAAKDFGSFSVEVHDMEEDEASKLLFNSSGLAPEQMTSAQRGEAQRIVNELGRLALAINLAGSYISNTPRISMDLSQYLLEYHDRRKILLGQKSSHLRDEYAESVLSTWEVSFAAMSRKSPTAAKFLVFLAFLDATDIFPELFDALAEDAANTGHEKTMADSWQDAITHQKPLKRHDIEEAFSTLRSFSFVRWMPDRATYSMHKLVHAWGGDRLDLAERIATIRATALFLQERTLCDPETPEQRLRLVPHLMASFNAISQLSNRTRYTELSNIYLRALPSYSRFLDELGHWSNEAKIKKCLLEFSHDTFGLEHPNTISAMNNLANTLGDQGKLDEAANILKEVLEKRIRILGVEHPNTISAMNNLANTLKEQGKLDEAANIMKDVLEKRIRILGVDHPDTTTAMNNLASTLGEQGKLDEAANLIKEVLEKMTRILGVEHPKTISAIYNLAITLGYQGKLDEAADMMKEVLEKMTRILGVEHHRTTSAAKYLDLLSQR